MKFETNEFFLKSRDEMLEALGGDAGPLDRTWEIAQMCDLKIDKIANPFPDFEVPQGHTGATYFEYIARQGLEKRRAYLEHQREKGLLRRPLE